MCYEHTPSQQRNSAALICSLSAWHTTSCMSLPFLRKFSVFFVSQKCNLTSNECIDTHTLNLSLYIVSHVSYCTPLSSCTYIHMYIYIYLPIHLGVWSMALTLYMAAFWVIILQSSPSLSLSPGMPWCWRYQRRRRGSTSSTSCRRPDATPGSPVSTGTYTASPRTTEPSNTTNQQWCHVIID